MTVEAKPLHPDASSALRDRLTQMQARVSGRLKLGLHAKFTRYGLRRDLAVPITNPSAKIPIAVRPLQQDTDLGPLFSFDGSHDPAEKLEVAWRRAFVDKGARGGFVAVDQRSGTPCFVQWLFGSQNNDFIQRLGGFPVLSPQEALLENAYTPPGYRGFGIMSAAMALIAERATEIGARHVLTFVDQYNIASLKGCQRAGFHPQRLHHRTRLGFGLIQLGSFRHAARRRPEANREILIEAARHGGRLRVPAFRLLQQLSVKTEALARHDRFMKADRRTRHAVQFRTEQRAAPGPRSPLCYGLNCRLRGIVRSRATCLW